MEKERMEIMEKLERVLRGLELKKLKIAWAFVRALQE